MQLFTFMTYVWCLPGNMLFSFGFNGMASIADSLQAVSKFEYRKDAVSSVPNVCRAAHLFPTLVRKSLRISLSYCNVVQSYGLVLLFFFVLALKLNFMCSNNTVVRYYVDKCIIGSTILSTIFPFSIDNNIVNL